MPHPFLIKSCFERVGNTCKEKGLLIVACILREITVWLEYPYRALSQIGVELLSALFAWGVIIRFVMNPDFFQQSNYLNGIERTQQTGILLSAFAVVAIVQTASIHLTRRDTSEDMDSEPKWSPRRIANQPGIFILRASGFTLGGMAWFYYNAVTNYFLILSPARAISFTTLGIGLISLLSVLYAWGITADFIRSRRYLGSLAPT